MKIELMDKNLYEKLINEKEGSLTVHSVFNQACNLYTPQGIWLTLVSKHRWLPPNGVKLNHIRDFRDCYQQDERIRFSVKDQKIKLLDLNLHSLKINENESRKNKKVKLEYMKTYLELQGQSEAIGNLKLPKDVKTSFRTLDKALEENNLEKIKNAARGLIGFGSGLTPSMDDYLTGRILMWKTWMIQSPTRGEEDFSRVIKEASKGRTTTASEWMIQFAAEGRCSEEIIIFLHSFFSKSSGDEFGNAFREVLCIGSTSGEDLMYGMWSEGTRLLMKYEGGNNEWD